MYRILFNLSGLLSGTLILIPIFLIYQKYFFHNWKKNLIYFMFSCYLMSVWVLTGLPNVENLILDISYNIVPFSGMLNDIGQTLLNVLLFVPLGFFLPIINKKYRKIKNILLFCFLNSVTIEILQMFTYRATDINDIISNVIGTIIGYFIINIIIKKDNSDIEEKSRIKPLIIIYITIFIIMMFIQFPIEKIISNFIKI